VSRRGPRGLTSLAEAEVLVDGEKDGKINEERLSRGGVKRAARSTAG